MKSESLLSLLSNLSSISNISYREAKTNYLGAQFFNQSLPFAYENFIPPTSVKF